MPSRWTRLSPHHERLELWPNRSLTPGGFVTFFLITFVLLMLPLFPLLGTAALWAMLPFLLAPLVLLWLLLKRSYRDGRLCETLDFTEGQVSLLRREPSGAEQHWQAQPYWVRPELRPAPLESYLVLTGGPREVELGAFLSPEERLALLPELEAALARAAGYGLPKA